MWRYQRCGPSMHCSCAHAAARRRQPPRRRRTLGDPRLYHVAAVLGVPLQAYFVQPPLALAHLAMAAASRGGGGGEACSCTAEAFVHSSWPAPCRAQQQCRCGRGGRRRGWGGAGAPPAAAHQLGAAAGLLGGCGRTACRPQASQSAGRGEGGAEGRHGRQAGQQGHHHACGAVQAAHDADRGGHVGEPSMRGGAQEGQGRRRPRRVLGVLWLCAKCQGASFGRCTSPHSPHRAATCASDAAGRCCRHQLSAADSHPADAQTRLQHGVHGEHQVRRAERLPRATGHPPAPPLQSPPPPLTSAGAGACVGQRPLTPSLRTPPAACMCVCVR